MKKASYTQNISISLIHNQKANSRRSVSYFLQILLLALSIITFSPLLNTASAMPSETEIIEGTEDFIIERAEAELMQWLIESIRRDLCENDGIPISGEALRKIPTPHLCSLSLETKDAISIPTASFIKAIKNDMQNLPVFLSEHTDLNINMHLVDVFHIFADSVKRKNYNTFFHELSSNRKLITACRKDSTNLACSFYILGLVTNYNKNPTGADIENKLKKDLGKNHNITKSWMSFKTDAIYVDEYFTGIRIRLNDLDAQMDLYKDNIKTGDPGQRIDIAREIGLHITGILRYVTARQEQVFNIGPMNEFQKNIDTYEYAFNAITYFSSERYQEGFQEIILFTSRIKTGNEINSKYENVNLSRYEKYYTLFVSFADTKSSEDVKNILNTHASATGSWRMKRGKNWYTSFGALAGGQVGSESVYLKNGRSDGYSYGPFIPIGIDLSFNRMFAFEDKNSTDGLFLSFFDLGNLLNERINKKEPETQNIKTDPDFTLKEVASLGLYYKHGAGKSPFTWGFGYSYSPSLRLYDNMEDDRPPISLKSHEVKIFIGIDIMIFPLSY